MTAPPAAAGSPSRLDRLAAVGITRGVLALCLLWVVAVGPIVHDLTAQGAPRVALTGAIHDDQDIKIDGYLVGFDYAERDGHTYSDKAPGQEVLALPAYAAARALGAEAAVVPRVAENLTLWWVTFATAGLPALAIILLVAMASHRRGTPVPLPALAALSFGTMLLPFAANLYGHVLGAALGYAAWLVLDRSSIGWRRGAVAGGLLALAVSVEYPLAIMGVALVVLLAVRRHWSALVAFAAAGVPFAVGLALYQDAAFGSPFSSGYTGKSYHQGAALLITGIPDPATLAQVLFGSRGLLLFTPVVAVGIYGLVRRWRDERDDGAAVALGVVVGFVLLQAGWVNPWGGDGPGPRYVIPMLPFLGIGLAHAWRSLPAIVRRWVLLVSLVSMVLPTITFHLVGRSSLLIVSGLQQLREAGLNPTVWSIALGPAGWVLYGLTSAAGLWWFLRAVSAEGVPPEGVSATVRSVEPARAAVDAGGTSSDR